MIKVRFNLGNGANYKKWQVKYSNGKVEHYDPAEAQLIMTDCRLINQLESAKKIFKGGHKRVCAWVTCAKIRVKTKDLDQSPNTGQRLCYNPRLLPHWILDGTNADGKCFSKIESVDNVLYVVN